MCKSRILLAALMIAVTSISYAKQANYPATQEALENEFANLPWEAESISYQLSKSNSALQLPDGLMLLREDGAERYMYLSLGSEYPGVEAVIVKVDNFHLGNSLR